MMNDINCITVSSCEFSDSGIVQMLVYRGAKFGRIGLVKIPENTKVACMLELGLQCLGRESRDLRRKGSRNGFCRRPKNSSAAFYHSESRYSQSRAGRRTLD